MKTPEELREKPEERGSISVFQKNLHLRNVQQTIENAVEKAVSHGFLNGKGGVFVCNVEEEDLSVAVKYLAKYGCYRDSGPIYSTFEIKPMSFSVNMEKVVVDSNNVVSLHKTSIDYFL